MVLLAIFAMALFFILMSIRYESKEKTSKRTETTRKAAEPIEPVKQNN